MNVVEQFLGQGVLPFVGREGEIERILDFWRGTVDSQRLRLLLLTAEAGAGKSRLLEESVAMIENDGGVVIHAKLYPEGTNDLTSLLTQALQRKKKDQRVPGIRAAEEVKGIVPSLQRLSRLRPLLLVIEDLHLMPEEALPDLTTLLSQLADETISVLGCARPVQMQARSRLESFLVDTLEMKGLSPNAIAKLWKELFADEPKNWVPSALHKATFGNPLALRSAIRALIHGRGVEQRSASQIWKLNISQQEFEGLVHQSVSLVVEGLVAQLTPELRQKAARLAMLGEVFARESAEYLLGSTEALDQLQATGLLLLSGYPASSLAGYIPDAPRFNSDGSYPGSRSPLIAFTHSLLHNYLVAEVEGDAVALCELLSRNLPLYSLVPLRLLRSVQIAEEISGDVLSNSFQRVIIVAQRFDRTSNWKEGHNVWETARHLLSFLKERIPPEEYHYINVVFLTVQLSIWRRERGSKRWLDTLEKGIEATENYSREWEAYARILLWAYWGEYYGRVDYQNTFTAEKNAREVLERFPDQKYRPSWVYHLEMLTLIALQVDDEERIADMQQEFDTFLADPTLPPEIRSSLIQRLAKFFLMYFSTQEELAERVASLELIEEEVDELSPFFGTSKSYFLLSIGRFAEAEELARRLITISYDLGEWGTTLTAASVRAMAAVATGASIEFAAKELKEGIELVEQNKSVGGMTIAANAFLHILLFLGIERPEQALRQLFDLSIDQLTNQQLALIGIWNHDLESASILLKEDHINQLYLKGERVKVWKDLLDPETPLSFEGLDRLMKREILELRDILSVQGASTFGWQCKFLKRIEVPSSQRRWMYWSEVWSGWPASSLIYTRRR
ncbi:MAG: AAA family ATPase [Ignavibacteria bacterium]|nr:AAA family ATPase [Ignavibacteria bacterium]